MKANLPVNEVDRLLAVEQTGLMDSAPDDEFDCLVRLASVVCETPIALVTLVDHRRQWFKARIGLESTETSRDIAFCAHTILQPDLFQVRDATLDPRFCDNPLVTGELGIRFYAGVPLNTAEGLHVGTLCVIDRSPRDLLPGQLEALHLLADQVKKHINLRTQRNMLAIALAATSTVEQELRRSQSLFHAFMDHAPFLGFMKDAEGKLVYYNQRLADRFSIGRQDWVGKGDAELWPLDMAGKMRENDLSVLREWKIVIADEEASPTETDRAVWRSYKFPFRDSEGHEYVAGFAVDVTREREAQRSIESYQEALLVANERLQTLAITDTLTELLNRRAFDAALERDFSTARRYKQELSLMYIDVDDFKSINDSFGHEEGDRVLRAVAKQIQRCFRTSDVVARYGGEEFAVILPNTSGEAAAEAAERLRLQVNKLDVGGRRVSVSIGLSTMHVAQTKAELIRIADGAMYTAKRQGKNRVCRAS